MGSGNLENGSSHLNHTAFTNETNYQWLNELQSSFGSDIGGRELHFEITTNQTNLEHYLCKINVNVQCHVCECTRN